MGNNPSSAHAYQSTTVEAMIESRISCLPRIRNQNEKSSHRRILEEYSELLRQGEINLQYIEYLNKQPYIPMKAVVAISKLLARKDKRFKLNREEMRCPSLFIIRWCIDYETLFKDIRVKTVDSANNIDQSMNNKIKEAVIRLFNDEVKQIIIIEYPNNALIVSFGDKWIVKDSEFVPEYQISGCPILVENSPIQAKAPMELSVSEFETIDDSFPIFNLEDQNSFTFF